MLLVIDQIQLGYDSKEETEISDGASDVLFYQIQLVYDSIKETEISDGASDVLF